MKIWQRFDFPDTWHDGWYGRWESRDAVLRVVGSWGPPYRLIFESDDVFIVSGNTSEQGMHWSVFALREPE